jgi:HK97 family phage major capsid protein
VTQITTDNGRDLPIPTDNEAGVKGELVAENAAAAEDDPAFGQVTLKAFLWSSKLVKVPRTLLQDNAFNLDAYLSAKFGQRIGRIQADFYHDGTGTNEPEGIITGTVVGHTTASTQVDSFLYDDFVMLEHSVDPAYREQGHYLLSDGALREARLIKDMDDRPIWVPAMAGDIPSTINGFPYTIVMELAAPAASAKPIVFGDLSYYWIRDVIGFEAIRLNELFAQNRQVGFLAWARSDGRNVNPGNDPYKVMAMAAS